MSVAKSPAANARRLSAESGNPRHKILTAPANTLHRERKAFLVLLLLSFRRQSQSNETTAAQRQLLAIQHFVLHKSSWNKMHFPHCSPETFCRLFPVGLPLQKNRNTVHMPVPVPLMHNPSWFSCYLFLSIFSRSNAVPPTLLHACNSQASDNNNLVSKTMYGLPVDGRTVLAVLLCSTAAFAIQPHRLSPKSSRTASRIPSWKLANLCRVAVAASVLKTVSIRQSARLLPATPKRAKFSSAFCETVAAMFPPVQSESNCSAPILPKPSRLILNTIHTESGCPFCRSGENRCVPNTCSTGAVVFRLRFVSPQPMHKVHPTGLVHRVLPLPAILQSAAKMTCRKAAAK